MSYRGWGYARSTRRRGWGSTKRVPAPHTCLWVPAQHVCIQGVSCIVLQHSHTRSQAVPRAALRSVPPRAHTRKVAETGWCTLRTYECIKQSDSQTIQLYSCSIYLSTRQPTTKNKLSKLCTKARGGGVLCQNTTLQTQTFNNYKHATTFNIIQLMTHTITRQRNGLNCATTLVVALVGGQASLS